MIFLIAVPSKVVGFEACRVSSRGSPDPSVITILLAPATPASAAAIDDFAPGGWSHRGRSAELDGVAKRPPRRSERGTGLCLDISRRIIVERHGGEITIESRPDETLVVVRLPLRSTKTH